ncbi:MAG UNVERIFIED_CONTAM: hypothetical protein LVT10_12835 [Anaerolineae bacterium]|jgi:fused signal recognition particle receptor
MKLPTKSSWFWIEQPVQNALQQAKKFSEVVDVTGIIVTKLDGTAKGGMIFSIFNDLKIPIHYIGLGEGFR